MSDALIVVDMIHDFVDGKFGSENAKKIVPRIKDLIEKARRKGVLIVYTRDSHKPGDPELKIWGEHAMEGSKGSEVVEDLAPTQGDFVVSKTTYDSFFNTELERILKDHGVKNVYIVGVATDICVLHTAFGAFARGFNVFIVKDCVASINEEGHEWALKYMQTIYGAKIVESEELF
ncbi:MAG: cysteine hydrolase [Candidatus Coatesbacteria bacterium]|nr:MAG: cysteine hydrolase [Candidatus Coatesbacteria bacterium]